ncbi:MAG: M56 family metallopeptidase [Opitutaceae bacterium]
MSLLFALSVRGSLLLFMVVALDWLWVRTMRARGRRLWWWLIPLAFLVPVRFSIFPSVETPRFLREWADVFVPAVSGGGATMASSSGSLPPGFWLWLWSVGAGIHLLLLVWKTICVTRRWSRERLSTDAALLGLLEDCKQEAGVTAPVGLVVSPAVPTPVLLGWLRPRILLPFDLVAILPREALRSILLHELAHFRSWDVPLNWLYALARAVHWFNPLAYLAAGLWGHFQEEAADESAIRWRKEASGKTYGDVLLQTLKQTNGGLAPFGALAIGESNTHLKRRIKMIRHYPDRKSRPFVAGIITLLLLALTTLQPARAGGNDTSAGTKDAVLAMETWLRGVDAGNYAQSWKDASARFQKAVSEAQWQTAVGQARKPYGKLRERKLLTAGRLSELPASAGETIKGDFVFAQFEASFDNGIGAIETVTFEKEANGNWKAAGYFIKPGVR